MDSTLSLPSAYTLASSRRWGRTQSLTVTPTGSAQGRREFLSFRPGFYLSLGHITHRAASREVYRSGDFIKLHFRLEGESHVGQAGAAPAQKVDAMSVTTLLQPPGAAKEEWFAGDVRERSLTLCCSRSFLADELGLSDQQMLEGPFSAFMQATPARFELLRFPLATAQYDIAEALLDDGRDDALRPIFAEAKAFELLHGFLVGRADDHVVDPQTASARERLAPIKEYIDAHLCESIEMHGLARRFGWSESRLSRQFKQAFGMALFDYIGTARLTRARALLEAGRLSINQVALAVGYQHTANFSTAFKRQFGVSPHAVRKPGRLAS